MPIDRLSALCEQTALTGIDFIQVVDPQDQTRLRVFFIVEPSILDTPMVDANLLDPPGAAEEAGDVLPEPGLGVTIQSTETGVGARIDLVGWRLVRAPAGLRLALEIAVREPGDFALYRLTIDDARIDLFFNDRQFSFKQGCPSAFDCREGCDPVTIESDDYPVDYLARDFWSFRRALLDMAAARYPGWSEPLEADQAVMLVEIMAALGDELSYMQDRIARELALDSASQRRSRSSLARLVDYMPDPGAAAETELAVFVAAGNGGALTEAAARAWALPEGRDPIPFSVERTVWHHEAWNRLRLHQPDADVACLPAGATEAWLATRAPTPAQLPPAEPQTPEQFWVGRRAILRSRPADPAEPYRAFAVTITEVEHAVDSLVLTSGLPTDITRIAWTEPTPFPLSLAETEALLNIAAVTAGERVSELFRIGSDAAALRRHPALGPVGQRDLLALPRAVERQGPLKAGGTGRERILRYGLRASETRGLGWKGPRDPLGIGAGSGRAPMLQLREVTPPLMDADPNAPAWTFHRDILTADLDTAAFALEEGMWRPVVVHQSPSEDFTFQDYAGDAGWSVRFGDGDFGRPPEDGTVVEAVYFTAAQADANLPADSVVELAPPPGASPGPVLGHASAVTNPLPIDSGVAPESAADIRINAPEAWRAWPLRAVRSEDYSEIVERLDWVQRASSVTAWTGSWSTDFVAADPLAGISYSQGERDELEHVVACVGLAGRDARVADPDYLDIDLDISVCIAADAYAGEVLPKIIRRLAPPGFFHVDKFTFGQPLRRSALEAFVQATPGVKGVEEIRLRVRRRREWELFEQSELPVGPGQIIRLQNDPLHPSRGSLRVTGHGGAA